MKTLFLSLLIIISIVSCKNQSSSETITNNKLDSLLNENKRLNDKILAIENNNEELDFSNTDSSSSNNSSSASLNRNIDDNYNSNIRNEKFAFVVLSLHKKEFDTDKWRDDLDLEQRLGTNMKDKGLKIVEYYVTSPIVTFNKFDDDIKYNFMDEVQSNYRRNSFSADPGKITKRECFVFDNYKDASLARSKYTTNE